jgi:hypothetical protein
MFLFLCSFFAAALQAGTMQILHLNFVILDKLGLLFFCIALLVFVGMWSRAISLMVSESAAASLIIVVTALVFAAVIFAIVIYFAIVISLTYINWYYFDFVTDYADVVLSCITCFFALCLLCQIIYVAARVKVVCFRKNGFFMFFSSLISLLFAFVFFFVSLNSIYFLFLTIFVALLIRFLRTWIMRKRRLETFV